MEDIKSGYIRDVVILPAIIALFLMKLVFYKLQLNDLYAVVLVFVLFTVFIAFNLKFGGGDVRFGVFCALFLGLHPIGWFILFSGVLQLLFL